MIHSDSYLNAYQNAVNPITKPSLLVELSEHSNERVRSAVAENPSTPADELVKLSADSSSEVRQSVCDNPNTPPFVLELLAQDDCPDVRYSLAENSNVPAYILRSLMQDENCYVSHRAKATLNRLQSAGRAFYQLPLSTRREQWNDFGTGAL